MKQPKKRWAWTAQQRGKCHHHLDHRYNHRVPAPPRNLLREQWHQHRAHTRRTLCQVVFGFEEAHLPFSGYHRHAGRSIWTDWK